MLQTNTVVEGGDEDGQEEGGKGFIRQGDEEEPREGGKGFILSVALVEQEQILAAFHMHLGMLACLRVQTR